jgi:hypothetical protein
MIAPKCDKCGNELKDFGGLVFTPPLHAGSNTVYKFHICGDCYMLIRRWMLGQLELVPVKKKRKPRCPTAPTTNQSKTPAAK